MLSSVLRRPLSFADTRNNVPRTDSCAPPYALARAQQVALTPAERFELPQSSNQDYGFVSAPLVPKSALLDVGRTTCDAHAPCAHCRAARVASPLTLLRLWSQV